MLKYNSKTKQECLEHEKSIVIAHNSYNFNIFKRVVFLKNYFKGRIYAEFYFKTFSLLVSTEQASFWYALKYVNVYTNTISSSYHLHSQIH